MWFITGLDDGQIALFIKLHHAVGDGMAGVAILAAFVDLSPDEPRPSRPDWNPADLPTNSDLFRDNLLRRLEGLKRRSLHLAHPITGIRRLRATWPFIHEVFAVRAPRTSLNRPVGPDRTMAVARGRLETYRRIAEAHGSKVNDVLLSAIGGGLRDLLISRREPVDGLVLWVMVPVSLHQDLEHGNTSSGMAVPISIGEADSVSRLKLIAAETAERKKMARPTLGLIFQSEIAQKALLRVFRRQRFENLYVTNVPGPPVPLYFSGAQILEIFPIVPTAGNVTLGIGALSYTGQFNITAIGDRELCPDLDVLLQGFQRSIDELAASVLVDTT